MVAAGSSQNSNIGWFVCYNVLLVKKAPGAQFGLSSFPCVITFNYLVKIPFLCSC